MKQKQTLLNFETTQQGVHVRIVILRIELEAATVACTEGLRQRCHFTCK